MAGWRRRPLLSHRLGPADDDASLVPLFEEALANLGDVDVELRV